MLGEPECGSGFESREVLVSPRPICDTTHQSLPTRWGVRPQSGPGAFFCLASVRSDRRHHLEARGDGARLRALDNGVDVRP